MRGLINSDLRVERGYASGTICAGAAEAAAGDDFSGLATVNPEMTQEVQVETSAFGADTANGPNVINTTGKSGGEHYHGEAYFDARNDALNANDWQDNHTGHPKAGAVYYYPCRTLTARKTTFDRYSAPLLQFATLGS
jgi:hypothetical protein